MTKATNTEIIDLLGAQFGERLFDVTEPYGLLTFSTSKDDLIPVLSFLKENGTIDFNFLTDITAVHYPDQNQIAVVYHVHSMVKGIRVRLKVFLNESNPSIQTASALWNSANWMERETFDFFGVKFEGHPDLRRILNMDDLGVHPMLRQYPLEDPNRVDKKDEFFGR
ncbi:MAG: NADH-quinone oxidoreductase subunit C [Pedobacter sp.]|nr:MAG: NADH-quinone oxidoreductase subunit C [Pedobacter sp.]